MANAPRLGGGVATPNKTLLSKFVEAGLFLATGALVERRPNTDISDENCIFYEMANAPRILNVEIILRRTNLLQTEILLSKFVRKSLFLTNCDLEIYHSPLSAVSMIFPIKRHKPFERTTKESFTQKVQINIQPTFNTVLSRLIFEKHLESHATT
ncbi:hypothetical protein NQ315_003409 [Exocentrus adspersus]|uniref:Uncharacterized protein n=1 Tax=Exocentrus adspersus TaxID=1586481 RepID=A0AAV8VNQ6_9CUCU|nr:hypothetical protein NQ315_003409 [Exocentrus adspersus]